MQFDYERTTPDLRIEVSENVLNLYTNGLLNARLQYMLAGVKQGTMKSTEQLVTFR
jgi:hypothetical protein